MVHPPTLDKLESIRLKGMIEAWKAQKGSGKPIRH